MKTSTSRGVVGANQSYCSPRSGHSPTKDISGFDPEELTRLLRPYSTPSPTQHEIAVEHEAHAKRSYDQLVQMGARPTRPLRLQPVWTATYEDESLLLRGEDGRLEYDLPDWIDPMYHHWKLEKIHFSDELANWRKFKKYQQDLQHLDRLETGLELRYMDASSINALNRLTDWRDFEAFQYQYLTDATNSEDRRRQKLLEVTEWEASADQSAPISPAHRVFGGWLRSFKRNQEAIEAAKKQLKWIRDQWPKVVTEAFASVSMTPNLQSSLEAGFEKQTLAAFNAIQKLGGRPSHAVSPPDESMDVLHRILYWISEKSKYMDELLHLKHFIEWRRGRLGEDSTLQRGEYQCPKLESVLEYSGMVEEFRQVQHNEALNWLERWRGIVSWLEEEIEAPRWHEIRIKRNSQLYPPRYLYVYGEAARSHVRNSEQAVADSAARLGKARQEHAYALSEHGQSLGDKIAMESQQKPCSPTPSLPESNSLQSSQYSSLSSSQLSIPSPSPPSSCSSPPSVSPQTSQTSQPTPSPQSSVPTRKGRGLSDKSRSTDKQHRRSNKKNARNKETKNRNIDTEQQALPTFSSDSHDVEDDDNVQMEKASNQQALPTFSSDPHDIQNDDNIQMEEASNQQALPTFSSDPHDVEDDDNVQMEEAPESASQSRRESMEQSCGVDSEDTVMTEVEDPPTPITSQPSQPSSPIPNTKFKKLPLPAQGPIPRKTRSATKLDQATSSRVLKHTNKKPAKKAKAFTKQQTTTLLDAALNKSSTIVTPPLRRSERLKEKAALSAATAEPPRNANHATQPSQQKSQTRDTPNFGESPVSSTQKKKRKREPQILDEPLPESAQPRQKRRRIR